jgi:hypothetical protein
MNVWLWFESVVIFKNRILNLQTINTLSNFNTYAHCTPQTKLEPLSITKPKPKYHNITKW